MKLTKFQWIQWISSIFMAVSTIFVLVVTCSCISKGALQKGEKKTNKALAILGVLALGVATIIGIILINTKIMSNQYLFFNVVATVSLTAVVNCFFISIQQKTVVSIEENKVENMRVENMGIQTSSKPNNANKIIITVFVVFVAGVVLLVGTLIALFIRGVNQSHIPDQNGEENTALAVLTEDEIVAYASRYVSSMSGESRGGKKSQINDRTLKEYDSDTVSISCGSISGFQTLMATRTDSDSLLLTIDSLLESGNMEIFIIVDDVVYQRISGNKETTVQLDDIKGKTVLVKIAGESAKCKVSVSRDIR